MKPGTVVRLDRVSRRYRDGGANDLWALREVSVEIGAGELVSIEGPSGCGKTTLLNLLGLIDQPSEGRVFWDSSEVSQESERIRARRRLTGVGFIFQRFYLLPTLTSRENVELPMRARGVSRASRRARADQLLEEVGLTSRHGAYPHELSGGEEQRVAIARALANGPGLILADEPTGELDSGNAGRVLDLLVRLHRDRGTTMILVTHDPGVASRASRHLEMRDGRITGDRTEN